MLYHYLRLRWRARRYRRSRDRHEIEWILANIAPGDCVLDIGAHKGGYTYWMARGVGRGGLVVAFEPQPPFAAGLREAFTTSRHVRVENMALSDRAGMTTLFLPRRHHSPLATLEPGVGGENAAQVSVQTDTLDRYAQAKNLPRVKLIKCDVEGHELAVFRGGEKLLARDKPALLFECEAKLGGLERVQAVFQFLEGLGYSGSFFDAAGKLAPVSQLDPTRHQRAGEADHGHNCVFVAGR